ncbi:uncharacterized protein CDV56_102298 [Aspergillus thermomutatus]|uniref:Uncharacterized protein n=1 Tax=Aspergillus thermomutatus TaxID=41047 RepID=A0A397G248_ASPTH|nr:uncharacterized protein CDV56_102298 [Aspergillus thermomutatus]RHZ43618.1 hypothetical protein CDV56_102298 [Aspergillus thermomutatus]
MAAARDNRKSVLITGCSPGGIGNSLAREFHRNGLRVFATARDAKKIDDLAALGIETLDLVVDDEESVKSCYSEGPKENLYSQATTDYTVPFVEIDLGEARRTFETNFFAVIHICKTFLPLLMKAKGTIVMIASLFVKIIPYVFGSVYNASKAALHSFSDTLRVELAPFGVNVTTVITGGVQSRIARTQRTLQPNSLYIPIEDEYARRVTHSPVRVSAMALVMAVGARTKELDLGRQQELGDLVPMWRLGLDRSISRRHDEDVQALQVEKDHREVEAKGIEAQEDHCSALWEQSIRQRRSIIQVV